MNSLASRNHLDGEETGIDLNDLDTQVLRKRGGTRQRLKRLVHVFVLQSVAKLRMLAQTQGFELRRIKECFKCWHEECSRDILLNEWSDMPVGNLMNYDDIPRHLRPNPAFQSRKAAQACAFFASKGGANGMDKLKIVKLLYLAERKHIVDKHAAIVWDDLFSLKNGPVPSGSLNGLDGNIHEDVWQQFIIQHGKSKRWPARQFTRDDFDEMSNSEIRTLQAVWDEHGHRTAGQLVQYTHEHCAEYTETEGRRIPIRYDDILVATGMPKDEAIQVMADLEAWRQAQAVLHS